MERRLENTRRALGLIDSPKMVIATLFNWQSIFNQFFLDEKYGFVTNLNRAEHRLPSQYSLWEKLAADLPALTTTGKLKSIVDAMPILDVTPILESRDDRERAYMIISFMAHSYIRGRRCDAPLTLLPQSIAEPWVLLAGAIGTQPVCTYCSTAMFNFRLIDPQEPVTLDNLWTIVTASGSIDESWFFMVALAIDARSGHLLRTVLEAANAATLKNYPRFHSLLTEIALEISAIEQILSRMYESCIPAVFYQRVRRTLSGWLNDASLPAGLQYGSAELSSWMSFPGASAAQSPLMQAIDIVLGIRHARRLDHEEDTGVASAGNYIVEMRDYMSREQRDFLRWLEDNVNFYHLVHEADVPEEVREAYSECVARLRVVRDRHLAIVSNYIVVQAQKAESKTKITGTGGSNPIPFLKEVRSHMDSVSQPPQAPTSLKPSNQ